MKYDFYMVFTKHTKVFYRCRMVSRKTGISYWCYPDASQRTFLEGKVVSCFSWEFLSKKANLKEMKVYDKAYSLTAIKVFTFEE